MTSVVFPEIETKIAEEPPQKDFKNLICILTMLRVTIQGRQRWKFKIGTRKNLASIIQSGYCHVTSGSLVSLKLN
jgi:hypothetical protein